MRIGCCANMVSPVPGGIGIETLEIIAEAGYDYIELPLAQMMQLRDEEFELLTERVKRSGILCEVCNNFFPQNIKITGDKIDHELIERYIKKALRRIKRLGAEIIVFGSSGAKNIPIGFSYDKAWEQLVNLLRKINEKIGSSNITIVIEPLCRKESNIINTTSEGLRLAREVKRDHIKLLVDFYHMSIEKETDEVYMKISGFLRHVHVANPDGRVFPRMNDGIDYRGFFRKIKKIGYNKRVSVEAYTEQFEKDIFITLETMREADS